MPSHNHTASSNNTGGHNHKYYSYKNGGDVGGFGGYGDRSTGYDTSTAGTHSHTITIENTGSNRYHNNMQPYLSVYIWKRIA